jgi:NADH-ubiquinone oxidoreductase chain 5
MFLILIFSPFIGFLFTILFGRFLGKNGASIITVSCVCLSTIITMYLFHEIGFLGQVYTTDLGWWAHSDKLSIKWGFLLNQLTVCMAVVVLSISVCVHIYSISYMSNDPHIIRFLSYLSLFTFFMLILITSDNFVVLFLGWEGVGLCSYLLINFWFTRLQANKSAIKAFIINKIGDFSLLIAIGLIFWFWDSVDFMFIFAQINSSSQFFDQAFYQFSNSSTINLFFENNSISYHNNNGLNGERELIFSHSPTGSYVGFEFLSCLLFLAAIGKSAQIGLHVWLPDAMEGPTPVSALIHAATMVTAGVFLLIRCSPILENTVGTLFLITIIGALTAFMAATIGLFQNDIKKVIAYSTCSQLGYMVFACGTSNYNLALYHLINHAFFKALLFLCAGSIIHTLRNEQDMRKMGGLFRLLPLTYIMVIIGSFALTGFPFLSGFYSKEAILITSFVSSSGGGLVTYWLGTISVFFTALYSFRLLYLVFLAKTNIHKSDINTIHDMPIIMAIPLSFLSICSIFSGYLLKDIFIGFGSNFFYNGIYIKPNWGGGLVEAEFLSTYIKLIPPLFSACGFLLGICIYILCYKFFISQYYSKSFFYKISRFYNSQWYFNNIYNNFIVFKIFNLGDIVFKLCDKNLLELFGPYNINTYFNNWSYKIHKMHNNIIIFNSFLFLSSICFFIGCYLF